MAAAGFRAERDSHHYRIIQSLVHTIGASSAEVAQLDQFRKKRNISSYDRVETISDQEVLEMIRTARGLRLRVEEWIHANHPGLA